MNALDKLKIEKEFGRPFDSVYASFTKLRKWQLEMHLTMPKSYVSDTQKKLVMQILLLQK